MQSSINPLQLTAISHSPRGSVVCYCRTHATQTLANSECGSARSEKNIREMKIFSHPNLLPRLGTLGLQNTRPVALERVHTKLMICTDFCFSVVGILSPCPLPCQLWPSRRIRHRSRSALLEEVTWVPISQLPYAEIFDASCRAGIELI